MKRSGPPKRKTPLARGTSQVKRTRLKPMSEKMRGKLPERRIEREAVFERDRVCQVRDLVPDVPCWGRLTFGHLWKDGQGGPYTRENGQAQCLGHNRWVEENPDAAYALGLVLRMGDHAG